VKGRLYFQSKEPHCTTPKGCRAKKSIGGKRETNNQLRGWKGFSNKELPLQHGRVEKMTVVKKWTSAPERLCEYGRANWGTASRSANKQASSESLVKGLRRWHSIVKAGETRKDPKRKQKVGPLQAISSKGKGRRLMGRARRRKKHMGVIH